MMKKLLFISLAICLSSYSVAINPVVKAGVYNGDPATRVIDGKLYIYGSRDMSPYYYCSQYYDVISTTDLKEFTLYPDTYASAGENDQVPYSDKPLYAPDVIRVNDTYHLVYCMPEEKGTQGVATSSRPEGPFTGNHILEGVDQIDPAFFQDDDGQVYLYWGQFSGKVAKMKDNMQEVDWNTYKDGIIDEAHHCFHEGIQMIKRSGIYYLVYAHIGRHGMPTQIGYSYGPTPYGPFKYGGIIIDNFGCDPFVWNNHGSIVEFKGQWYVFYHRSTRGTDKFRKTCIEPITFNADGTINEVEMTTQGTDSPLDPTVEMEAARACGLTGTARVSLKDADTEWLTHVRKGNTAVWKYFDFKQSPKRLTIKLTALAGGHISVFAGNLYQPLLANIKVKADGGEQTITVDVSNTISGVQPIYMRFDGRKEDVDLLNLESFRFEY